ncbi:aa3-type cytochrome c oxidase subunit IV [Phenylobacterium sp.]|uniref:aa3-type cytochrome c oxidase subunit IV n=1 Tax=Phenylobacterium sp. TaxID=1871053 RepID=UPI003562F9D9
MAGQASDYHRGDQDIHEQVSTFHLVMNITKWGSVILAALLLTLVLWFCTSAGFLAGAISGFVVLALGIALLRDRGGAEH